MFDKVTTIPEIMQCVLDQYFPPSIFKDIDNKNQNKEEKNGDLEE